MTMFVDQIAMETISCSVHGCGITFAIPAVLVEKRRNDHQNFWCPNGHCLSYKGKTEAQKLKDQLAEKEQQLDYARQRANHAEEKTATVTRAHKRMRERLKNGVCPCCNRSFENLRRHIADMHPDFGAAESIKALREALGLTQAMLAEEVGVRTNQVSLFERNKAVPQYASEALGAWLLTQGGEK